MQSPDDMINGAEDEDLLKNHLNNYSYVSSRVNAYQFITDNDISGNLYKVCSPVNLRAANAYDTYDYRSADKRKDAVAATDTEVLMQYYSERAYYDSSQDTPMRPDTDKDGLSTTNPILRSADP